MRLNSQTNLVYFDVVSTYINITLRSKTKLSINLKVVQKTFERPFIDSINQSTFKREQRLPFLWQHNPAGCHSGHFEWQLVFGSGLQWSSDHGSLFSLAQPKSVHYRSVTLQWSFFFRYEKQGHGSNCQLTLIQREHLWFDNGREVWKS